MNETPEIANPNQRAGVPALHKILIVRLGAMGDILHTLPAAILLKKNLPQAKIGWAVEKRWNSLLEWKLDGQPFPDIVHTVDTRAWRKNPGSSQTWREMLASFREIRAERYEVALDLQGAMKSAVVALLSGAPRRFGFAEPWEKPASLFYTNPLRVRARHVVDQNLQLAAGLLEKSGDKDLWGSVEWPATEESKRWLEGEMRRLGVTTPFAILNPGAGWGAKQWPVERYAEIARELGRDGVHSLVNYGPGEESLARHVEQNSDGHAVAARFTISELIAITSRASVFIGGDTGPMHLASLLKVPVVALFGPTDPARNGPYGTKSIVLRDAASVTSHKRMRETEAGLRNITAEQVLKAARELLRKKREGVRV